MTLGFGAIISAIAWLFPARAIAERIGRRLPWAANATDRPDRLDERPGYIFLSPAEAAFIEAAVARLIPNDQTGPGAIEAGVPRFIDRQLAGPYGAGDHFYLQPPFPRGQPTQGWQMEAPAQVYRAAIAAVDRWASAAYGRAFVALDASTQDRALKALEDGKANLGETDAKAFFALLLQNTIEGYFADPIYGGNRDMGAWHMIGFPGARYDLRPYVCRYGEPYALPPVGLTGRG
ncbi:MAG TPA: gluconate 2-dehydrogenase subunit 3 family protein [Sphingomicrobium sp.]|nr:gluconate 2-dehydrogenase subunit 3 family protein [Sphingomicrobium sp.]